MNNSAVLITDGTTQLKIVLSALLLSILLVSAIGNASRVCAGSASRDVSLMVQAPSPTTAAGPTEHIIR